MQPSTSGGHDPRAAARGRDRCFLPGQGGDGEEAVQEAGGAPDPAVLHTPGSCQQLRKWGAAWRHPVRSAHAVEWGAGRPGTCVDSDGAGSGVGRAGGRVPGCPHTCHRPTPGHLPPCLARPRGRAPARVPLGSGAAASRASVQSGHLGRRVSRCRSLGSGRRLRLGVGPAGGGAPRGWGRPVPCGGKAAGGPAMVIPAGPALARPSRSGPGSCQSSGRFLGGNGTSVPGCQNDLQRLGRAT